MVALAGLAADNGVPTWQRWILPLVLERVGACRHPQFEERGAHLRLAADDLVGRHLRPRERRAPYLNAGIVVARVITCCSIEKEQLDSSLGRNIPEAETGEMLTEHKVSSKISNG